MNLPNKITVFRFACIPFLLAASLIQFPYHWSVALVIYFIACMSDKADGIIARKQGLVTDFGKLMDPLSDKSLVLAAYLVFVNMGWHTELVIMLMMAREFLVAGIRMAAAAEGAADITTSTPWLNVYCAIAFWVVAVVTVLSGIVYAKDGWHLIRTK